MSAKTFDTTSLKDTYRDDLLALIDERRNHPERAPASSDKGPKKSKAAPTDIMELLKASVAKHQAPNSAPNQGPHRGKNGANSNDEIADDEKKAGESDGAQKKRRAAHRRPARRSIRPERKQE